MRSSSEKKLIILIIIVVVLVLAIAGFILYAFLSNGNNSAQNDMNFQMYNDTTSREPVVVGNNITQNTVVAVENTDNFTNCWVRVLPPWVPSERWKTLFKAAPIILVGSTP